jgi:hypothetical protein
MNYWWILGIIGVGAGLWAGLNYLLWIFCPYTSGRLSLNDPLDYAWASRFLLPPSQDVNDSNGSTNSGTPEKTD